MPTIRIVHRLQSAPAFQARAELDLLADWWQRENDGLCALIGLGGAGKTALAERFVANLLDERSPLRGPLRCSTRPSGPIEPPSRSRAWPMRSRCAVGCRKREPPSLARSIG